jgi:HlyD family secretion protein
MRRELEEKDETAKGGAGNDVTVSTKDKEKGKEELQGIFVIRNGRATFIQVDSGIMGSTDIEILKGVQPGDAIVTGSFSVLRTLKNNTKVRIDNTPVTTAPQQGS